MLHILLVGSGAREHVIAKAFKKSKHEHKLFIYGSHKNPGMFPLAEEYYTGDVCDSESVLEFAKTNKIDFCFIGPDNPIGEGVADVLESAGIKTIAPTKKLARLESSKGFTRNLLTKYDIAGNPLYKAFEGSPEKNKEAIRAFLESLEGEFVVKYDALLGGKGVKLSGEHLHSLDEGVEYALDCLKECGKVVIEEKLVGEEFSLIGITDGNFVHEFPIIQDHKRAYEGDTGPNTGGMGTYSDANHLLPFITEKDKSEAHAITVAVLSALQKECKETYKGVLYGGFIATKNGVRLIEYNARFGDPEAMNIFNVLETDFIDICLAILDGKLSSLAIESKNLASVCTYIVPKGYPEKPLKGESVILPELPEDIDVCYASTELRDGKLITLGSRTLALTALAPSIEEASKKLEDILKNIQGNIFYRADIGTKALLQKRIEHMKRIRG